MEDYEGFKEACVKYDAIQVCDYVAEFPSFSILPFLTNLDSKTIHTTTDL